MSWEHRNGGLYYTRSRRSEGRVIRTYVGGGDAGKSAADADAQRREQKRTELALRRQDAAEWQAIEAVLKECRTAVMDHVAALLHQAGYHRHDRGQWRRKR